MSRRHVYVLERFVERILVESIRPKKRGATEARREARERAKKLGSARPYGPAPFIRVRNATTDRVLVTYKAAGRSLAVKV